MTRSSTLQSAEQCQNCGSEILPAMVRCRECGTAKASSAGSKTASDHSGKSNNSDSGHSEPPQSGRVNSVESLNRNGKKKKSRVKTKCRKCHQVVRAPLSLAGSKIHCPQCGERVALPTLSDKVSSQKEAVESSTTLHSELLSAIKDALTQSKNSHVESRSAKESRLRGQSKKLVSIVESGCGTSISFETAKNAKDAIQKIVDSNSTAGGEGLLGLLPTMSDKIRPVALRALGELQVPNSLEPLLYTLLSSKQAEVESGIHALGEYGEVVAIRPLLLLQSVQPEQRYRTSVAINKFGEEALPILLETLENSTSEEMRFAAMEALKSLKSPKSIDALLSVVQRDRTVLRRMAVEALGNIEHPQKHRILMKLVKDKDPQVRSIALEALARNPHQSTIISFTSALDDHSVDVQKAAILGLGELGELDNKNIVTRLIKFLDSDDEEIQFLAARTISKLGDRRITPQILKFLKVELQGNADADRIRSLIKSLQRLKDPRAVLPLCELLEGDYDSRIQRRGIEALGAIGDLAAKPAIENKLVQHESAEVRAAAAQALGTLGDNSAITVLIQALHDSQNVRIQSLIALGKLKSTKIGPVIKEMLNDPSSTVRYQAINIMSESGDSSHVSVIEPLVLDPDGMVQRAALKALSALGDERTEKEIRKAAAKSQRGRKTQQVQHGLLPNSLVGLFSNVPTSVTAGAVTLLVLTGVCVSFFFAGTSSTVAGGKVVVRGYVQKISVDESGEMAVVSRTRGLTEVWNLTNNERLWSGENVPPASGVVYNSRSETALFTHGETVIFCDVSSSGEISNPDENRLHDAAILEVESSANRQFAVTLDIDQRIHLWKMEQKKSISNRSLPNDTTCVAVDNSGLKVASGGNRGSVKIWSHDANEPIYDNSGLMNQLQVKGTTRSIAFSDDSKYLAHCTSSGVLAVVDLENNKLLSKGELPPGETKLFFNKSNELIVLNAKISRLVDLKNSGFEEISDSIRARTAASFCSETNTVLMGSDEEKPVTLVNISSAKRTEIDID